MPVAVAIDLTKKLPETGVVDSTYRIEGSVKLLDLVGAPPFVYAKIRYKEWYKPEAAEQVDYVRGWPVPITGDFSLDFKPEKEGDYQVSVVGTPALVPLPVVGVMPTVAESEVMAISIGQKPAAVFRFSSVNIDGNEIALGNHDADSGLLLQKHTTDELDILASFEWVGPAKTVTISVKVGYKDVLGGFSPKTSAYTQTIELPESPTTPYAATMKTSITVPLTAAGNISDGAVEIVAKISGAPDYISHIWNVYKTAVSVVNFRFTDVTIDQYNVMLSNHDADSGLLLKKTTSDYLDVVPGFEWQGPQKSAVISIKAGYRDFLGGFSPKTSAYTRSIQLPESIDQTYSAEVSSPIRIPLVAAGGLDDGAIEVVLKISGEPDYISHIWNVYTTKEVTPPEEVIAFDLTGITATPNQVNPGSTVNIKAPVVSQSDKSQSVTAKVRIYEGSTLPSHGTLLETKTVNFSISPGQQYTISVNRTTVVGTIDRRDVGIDLYVGSQLIMSHEWDDVYYVAQPEEVIAFDLTSITATPSQVNPGTTVNIRATVVSRSDKSQSVTARVRIYEGSILPGHGTLLDTKTANFSISPGQQYTVSVNRVTVVGTIDRRDVGVDLYVGGNLIASHEWDDVYYVTQPAPPQISFQISTPSAYPQSAPPGPVVITIPVTSSSSNTMTVGVNCVVYEGSVLPGHGTFLWQETKNVTINPGQTVNVQFTRNSVQGTIDRRDVQARVIVNGDIVADNEWDDVFYVTSPTGLKFQVGILGIPDFGSYQYWSCSYWDPGSNSFVGDLKWYSSSARISFSAMQPGGYLAVFLKRDSAVSQQYNSPVFQPVNNGMYKYNVLTGVVFNG